VGFVFLLGLLFVCYTLTGYDASAHTSEETHDAQVNVPKGMWQAVFWSWTAGLIMVATFVLAMPSVAEGAATGWGSFYYVLGSSEMPSALLILLAAGIVVANYLCALAGLTSCSRMMFAFARDGGLPASGFLSQVSTQYRTPIYSIWTSIVIAWLSTLYAGAFVVLATVCGIPSSYACPLPLVFLLKAKPEGKGPFNLDISGEWCARSLGRIVLALVSSAMKSVLSHHCNGRGNGCNLYAFSKPLRRCARRREDRPTPEDDR
jgi:amino acid transporter